MATDLRTAVAAIPPECYARPAWKGLAYLGRDLGMYLAATVLLAVTDHPALVLPLWLLAGLGTSALFVVGHDAAHGALFASPRLCDVVARMAFLPSLHGLAPWRLGHNRVHHGFTGRAGIDFVWHPLTPTAFATLSRPARWLHRLEWSAWGAGLYYLRAVWWARMTRLVPPRRFRREFHRDRALVAVAAGAASLLALAWGWTHTGTAAGACWTLVKTLVVPWLVFNWIIGVTVYVHHIGPEIPWYTAATWSRGRGQVDATAAYRIPRWLNFFWHNVYVHTPHHVDPRIPFYHLPRAARALEALGDDAFAPRPLALRDYVAITRRCKLYDFDRQAWLDYAAAG
ncbi:MAG TPA: fatty acid desaturase [Candidatus Eisenbacteria bacterium]|nr:fatty acid desaturase [Candidatus Eisenbacteria bacterium]